MRALGAGEALDEPRETGFADRVRDCQGRVFGIAFAVLRNREDAEEIAQETFLRAYRRLGGLRDPGSFRAWVGRIAHRLALNRLRARKRRLARETGWQADRSAGNASPVRTASDRIDTADLARRIDRLPGRLREVLVLSAVEGLSSSEVAEILKIPPGTVRSRLHQARRRLLEEEEE